MYVIALTSGNIIYWMHSKMYKTKGAAKKALEKMLEQNKVNIQTKVYEMANLNLKEIQEG
jgi:hypothetical protein